jgi:phasin family protein
VSKSRGKLSPNSSFEPPYDNSRDAAWVHRKEHTVLKEPLTELSRENLESAMRLAEISMESAQKLVKLQLEASKMFVEENTRNGKSLAQAKTPEDVLALRTKFAESGFAKAMEYSRSLYEIAADTQAEFKQIVERRVAEYGRDAGGNAQTFQTGADLVSSALKATMAASTAAMNTLTQAAKEMGRFAESTFDSSAAIGPGAEKAKQAQTTKRRDREAGGK